MQPRAPFGLLALVLGGAVGALIGIAIYKSVGAWVVPVGFIVGALIGLVLWTAMRPDRRRGPRGPGA
ncbi:MAG TPA: hypothetical protein VKT78_05775, partial [Fimbriimonadaceae bacterium]|nr:hypothetical protein [Fimbriimonadaceae bacterium]